MHLPKSHIALALALAFLLAEGCGKTGMPAVEGGDIVFGTCRVQTGQDTKAGATLDTRTDFDLGDRIRVWSWHYGEAAMVFENQMVEMTTKTSTEEVWTYSPKKKWKWGDSDWYDFLAVPDGVTATYTPYDASSPFSLQVHYDAVNNPYDLLMAGTRRKVTAPNPSDIVQLDFQHMLSAVKVVFHREAGGQKFLPTSFGFKDVLVEANIVGNWDDYGKVFTSRLANANRSASVEFGGELWDSSIVAPWENPANFSDEYDPGFYDLMLPQNLDTQDAAPSLVFSFRDDVTDAWNQYDPEILLKDITVSTDTNHPAITKWEPGKVYIYDVRVLLNGGVIVNVITTEWDEIQAQTPGLMI